MGLANPTSEDVANLLTQSGVRPDDIASLPLDSAIKRAVEKWESDTGFKPFLSTPGQFVQSYPAPRVATLELRTGFVSIESLISRSETLVENEDYELRRFRGALCEAPFTEIKFFRPLRYTVLVTGIRGFCTELSQTVFDAITARAALLVVPSLSDASSATSGNAGGQVKARTVGDVRIEYTVATEGTNARLKSAPSEWQADYDDAVEKHRLVVWGL